MDAEILFFMSLKDQSDFLKLATNSCDSIIEFSDKNQLKLNIGECFLLFTPSDFEENILYTGKLEIRLSSFSDEITALDKDRAKLIFRKLRNWIKENYWSRLAYINQNKKDKLTPSRNHWLGPDAKAWKQEDQSTRLLKLSKSSWMTFELGY